MQFYRQVMASCTHIHSITTNMFNNCLVTTAVLMKAIPQNLHF